MLRTAVIGMGHIGHNHARSYQSNPDAELVAVCDRNPERAAAASKTFGVPAYTNAQKMLSEQKPDICSVATGGFEYSSDHYEPTMQALRAGCHVLTE